MFAPLLDFAAAEVGTEAVEKRFGAKPMLSYKMGEALGIAIAATGIYKDWVRLLIHDLPDLVRGWVAESYAMGGNFIVPHKEWGLVDFGGGDSVNIQYPGKVELIGPLYKFVRDNQALFDDYRPVLQVGLLYDYQRMRNGEPTAIQNICEELGNANVQFGLVVSGGGPYRHEFSQQDLEQYESVIVDEPVMVEGRQRELLDAWDRKGKLIRWDGVESVRGKVKRLVEAEPAGAIWVLPRIVPGRRDKPLVCHVLNRAFDAEAEKLVRHRTVRVRLNKEVFDGRPYRNCTLYMERMWPQDLPVKMDGEVVEVFVPYLELWGVLQFE